MEGQVRGYSLLRLISSRPSSARTCRHEETSDRTAPPAPSAHSSLIIITISSSIKSAFTEHSYSHFNSKCITPMVKTISPRTYQQWTFTQKAHLWPKTRRLMYLSIRKPQYQKVQIKYTSGRYKLHMVRWTHFV